MSFFQYLKDTQGELRHVAWPTRLQTIVYTILVTLISIGVSLYLGLFDYLFTSGLAQFLEILPASAPAPLELQDLATTTGQSATSTNSGPSTTTGNVPTLGF